MSEPQNKLQPLRLERFQEDHRLIFLGLYVWRISIIINQPRSFINSLVISNDVMIHFYITESGKLALVQGFAVKKQTIQFYE